MRKDKGEKGVYTEPDFSGKALYISEWAQLGGEELVPQAPVALLQKGALYCPGLAESSQSPEAILWMDGGSASLSQKAQWKRSNSAPSSEGKISYIKWKKKKEFEILNCYTN